MDEEGISTSSSPENEILEGNVTPDDSSFESLNNDVIKGVLLQAIGVMKIYQQLSKQSNTAQISLRKFPFLQKNTGNVFMCLAESPTASEEIQFHEQRLGSVLTSWNFTRGNEVRTQYTGGNGLFYATTHSILSQSSNNNAHYKSLLLNLLGPSTGIADAIQIEPTLIIPAVRQLVASEWTGASSIEYTSFLSETQLKREAERLLKDGTFDGGLGDVVLTALCNSLLVPILLFTSAKKFPIVTFFPTNGIITSACCINVIPSGWSWFVQHSHTTRCSCYHRICSRF